MVSDKPKQLLFEDDLAGPALFSADAVPLHKVSRPFRNVQGTRKAHVYMCACVHMCTYMYILTLTGVSKQDQQKRELPAQGISPLQAVQLMTCCGKVSRGAADNTFTTAGQLCQPLGGRATPLGGKGNRRIRRIRGRGRRIEGSGGSRWGIHA